MAKAPKLPDYQEVLQSKPEPKKPKKKEMRLTNAEWKKIDEAERAKQRAKKRAFDNNRERGITIAFRVSQAEHDLIYERIRLSGLPVRVFMKILF